MTDCAVGDVAPALDSPELDAAVTITGGVGIPEEDGALFGLAVPEFAERDPVSVAAPEDAGALTVFMALVACVFAVKEDAVLSVTCEVAIGGGKIG